MRTESEMLNELIILLDHASPRYAIKILDAYPEKTDGYPATDRYSVAFLHGDELNEVSHETFHRSLSETFFEVAKRLKESGA